MIPIPRMKIVICQTILFLTFVAVFQAKYDDDLYTCSRFANCMCRDMYYVQVVCKIHNELDILPKVFQDLQDLSIRELRLNECKANWLRNNLFINVSINSIRFYCPFINMEDESLSGVDLLENLWMSFTKFVEIPSGIAKLTNLMYLRLTNGLLVTVGRQFEKMTYLRGLSLKNNMIETIAHDAFYFNKNLAFLTLANNKIKHLHPKLFRYCPNLKFFEVKGNYLESSAALPTADSVETLQLSHNAFRVIIFHRYEDVAKLDISRNPLRNLSEVAFHNKFPHLTKLNMYSCTLTILPPGLLRTLFLLEYIDLSINSIRNIPPHFFQNLRRLKTVILMHNKLEYLEDDTFKNCRNITYVNLNKNRLKSLGTAFKDATALKRLHLRKNAFGVLRAEEFKYFTSLERLEIRSSKVTSLETNVFQMMGNLKELGLGSNALRSLNYSLKHLRSLERLNLNRNQLDIITEYDMHGLTPLKILHLQDNNLKNVNGAFRVLNNLQYLNLLKNKLITLAKVSFPQTKFPLNVMVSSNKWICDCRLLWLRELFIKGIVRYKVPLYCNKPKNFQTRKLIDLSETDLTQWLDGCPPPCNCSCMDEGNGDFFIKVDCSQRNMSEAPSVLPEKTGVLILKDNHLTTLSLNSKALRNLKTLDIERNYLKSLQFELPQSITTLKLAGNELTRFFGRPPSNIFLWTLSKNPWICDCEARSFREWMLQHINNISDIKDIRCDNHNSRKVLCNKVITELLDSDLCPFVIGLVIIVSVCILLLLLLATSSGLIYARYHYHIKVWLYSRGLTWLKKKDEDDDGKIYDAFISAADEDILWVRDVLLPELEEKYHYTIYEPRKNMMCGVMCAYEKELEVAAKSRRVIVLLSRNYIKNNFLMGVFKASFVASLEEKKYRLILIKIGDLPSLSDTDQSLKAAIESTRCLRFGQKLFWEMLRFAMPKTGSGHNIVGQNLP